MSDTLIEKLERAVMLIETAWMDIEPIPVEVAARDQIKQVISLLKSPELVEKVADAISGVYMDMHRDDCFDQHKAAKAAINAIIGNNLPAAVANGEALPLQGDN